ncbi:carbohydrate kinase [Burkholderia sp. BCCIQ04A]|uniref:Carbohydrate kinase n=1 Tax=Burkholderia anthinoferrum TaxID=3090833 RepID=A0ABU5WVI1_9BURK|nr:MULTISPECIES: carbohydrate kinase [Burkholderia]MEB2506570.1 carbohydrate kinase [Burkholderia anthinoferrum]MEB2533211.1 carbohydrate kinase [Burkholderia anthinoferrum]MEB2561054.1 carbohydrate kinase [Burkholderia anthinoferrum]MEB2582998.1 carbohydrate kinase [Burkholderia anthinoferrum]MCA8103874.1 carbohydrate kinase [Burkholderia sp. AU36459]
MTTTFPRLIVFGEALTDFIRDDAQHWRSIAGGSCWNVARVGARLGVPTAFAGTVSRDTFGDELMRKSADAGLDMRFIRQVDRAPLLAMVVSKQPPHYFFIGENSADLAFDPADLPAGAFDAADIVHVGSLGVVREPLASRLIELAQAARAAGKRISFDPNFRAPMATPSYRDTLHQLSALADWIKVSDEDLRGLFPELDEAAALAQLRAWAPDATMLVTRGAAGMQLLHRDTVLFQPAFPTEVADTVGCGDASIGGWLASQLARPDASAAEHLRYAAACAAVVCEHAGAYAPTAAEVAGMIERTGAGAGAALSQ